MWTGITREKMIELGGLDIVQVRDGFEQYESAVLAGDKEQIENFLQKCLCENCGKAYADFYYSVLEEREKKRFREYLNAEEKHILDNFIYDGASIYYPLTEKNLKFLSDITAECRLFSTFWYLKYPAVIWGNYELKYPAFFRNAEDMALYRKLAENCGLEFVR